MATPQSGSVSASVTYNAIALIRGTTLATLFTLCIMVPVLQWLTQLMSTYPTLGPHAGISFKSSPLLSSTLLPGLLYSDVSDRSLFVLTTILVHEMLFVGGHVASAIINHNGEKFNIIRKKVPEQEPQLMLQQRALRKAFASHVVLQPVLLWYSNVTMVILSTLTPHSGSLTPLRNLHSLFESQGRSGEAVDTSVIAVQLALCQA